MVYVKFATQLCEISKMKRSQVVLDFKKKIKNNMVVYLFSAGCWESIKNKRKQSANKEKTNQEIHQLIWH
jgi:hypothetical protein